MIDLDYVCTRFVIVEKFIDDKYFTPHFNQYGEIIKYTNRGGGLRGYGRIFIYPGIYTKELDETPALSSNLDSILESTMYVASVDVATTNSEVTIFGYNIVE